MNISRFHPLTPEGLRVTVASLPSSMPVQLGEGVEVAAETVADLRVLTELPHPIEVVIPYRVETGSIVIVSRASE